MNSQPSPSDPATSGASGFDERLSVPWWWYLPAIGVATLLGAEIHMGYPGLRSWLGYAVLIPLAVAVLVWLGRSRVRVVDGAVRVDDAVLALRHVGRVEVIHGRDAKQVALGPELDPAAYLLHRTWVKPIVRLEHTDPADPVPYWVLSVRDADAFVAAISR